MPISLMNNKYEVKNLCSADKVTYFLEKELDMVQRSETFVFLIFVQEKNL
jgi:hypothetical protein